MVWDAERSVDLARIGELLGVNAEDAREQLGDMVFLDPRDDTLVPAAEYLSGNVREKLAAARSEVAARPELSSNIDALSAVIPRDLGPDEITARMGAIWIPRKDVEQFLQETLDDPRVSVAHGGGSMWSIEGGSKTSQKAVSEWGTERMNALDLAQRLMTQKAVIVKDTELARWRRTTRRQRHRDRSRQSQGRSDAGSLRGVGLGGTLSDRCGWRSGTTNCSTRTSCAITHPTGNAFNFPASCPRSTRTRTSERPLRG
ncbi:hypothetical protein FV141_14265 (plasmid) [Dermacoccus abyssi]|uniref:DUF222 domain-containing protein n=1 Tax=Dermacoccus abyssi TaxID=322596 RepID=A0ABX5ZD29_9MICO|nr:hypothetical protein FV141_14265 [Dermacoccus abyssi]